MNLPPLSIPDFPLPFTIPEMMHPAIVHFAVALPVVILLLEIINLAARRKSIGAISFVLLVLMAVVYLGAYLTGSIDANKAKDLISPDTKTLLDAHKNGGIWLVYGTALILLLKLISAGVKKFPARIVFLAALGVFFWGTTGVVQKGCALTYKHGVNVHKDALTVPAAQETNRETNVTKETVEGAVEKAKNAVTTVTQTVKEKAAHVVEKTKDKVTEAVDAVTSTTDKAAEKADAALQEVKTKAEEAVKKAVEPAQETAPATQSPQPVTPVEAVPAG